MLKIHFLGSGSRGNATVLRWQDAAILIDCGFAPEELDKRLRQAGVSLDTILAVFVSHEHADHVAGLPLFRKRAEVTLCGSKGTLRALAWSSEAPCKARALELHVPVPVGPFVVRPFPVSHDAQAPVGYVIELPDARRVGLVTDLGYVSGAVVRALADCHVLGIETNHDPELLRAGPYPPFLQQRIRSRRGHLSNAQAGALLERVAGPQLEHVYALHISQANNQPELALRELEGRLALRRIAVGVTAVSQHEPTHYPPRGQLSLF